jgi:hypothetical protein
MERVREPHRVPGPLSRLALPPPPPFAHSDPRSEYCEKLLMLLSWRRAGLPVDKFIGQINMAHVKSVYQHLPLYGLSFVPVLVRPLSRGTVTLASSSPFGTCVATLPQARPLHYSSPSVVGTVSGGKPVRVWAP